VRFGPRGLRAPCTIAISYGSTHQLALSWNDRAPGVTFNICRDTVQGGEILYVTGQPAVNCVDTNAVGGTRYWYYATAVLEGDESSGSDEVSAAVPITLGRLSGLTVTSVNMKTLILAPCSGSACGAT